MSDDRTQIGPRCDPDIYADFKAFTREKKGRVRGELGRMLDRAMSEYMDNDRGARIERKVDVLLDRIDGTHTHTPSETGEKAQLVAERIAAGGRITIPDDDVVRAIEDIAGADDRTIAKYREQLKRQGLAWKHPTGGVWTTHREQWLGWVDNHVDNNPAIDLHDVLDPYPMGYDEYHRTVTAVVE